MKLSPLLLLASAAACASSGCAPARPAVSAASAAYFVGVWTTSDASYDAAARATAATRFAADGTFANGTWEANGFRPAPSTGPTRGFVPRYLVDASTKAITFFLDGAEEHAAFTIDGEDRWKTVATTAEGTFVVHYRRKP